ncbi:DNAse I-like superfamily protein [Rhynchospora pubera]|uniref:DNAse I-like superfamily protein n=1 Tax=Rhynchospora pubera TaxID=906938 RepID=A0AAV8H656_9POAL|nr:DNAse I-like superfamily protein [Rhynchospora pubera]
MAFLSETKCSSRKAADIMGNIPLSNHIEVHAVGKSGGLALLWDNDVHVDVLRLERFCIIVKVCTSDKKEWIFMGIYGDPSRRWVNRVWDYLSPLVTAGWPVCLAGDFNAILSEEEKYGGNSRFDVHNRLFRQFVFQTGLIDLGFKGPAFTWTNKRYTSEPIYERLDRVLVNDDWSDMYAKAEVLHLPRIYSDHAGILLKLEGYRDRRRKEFKVEHCWLQEEGFTANCKDWWEESMGRGIVMCFQDLARKIQKWDRKKERPADKLRRLEGQILALQSMSPQYQNSKEETALMEDYYRTEDAVNSYWRQRAKQRWITQGDRNTAFFHIHATNRRRNNLIYVVKKKDGQISGDRKEIRKEFVEYFKMLYCQTLQTDSQDVQNWFDQIKDLQGEKIANEDHERLTRKPNELEIQNALFKMHSDSALLESVLIFIFMLITN